MRCIECGRAYEDSAFLKQARSILGDEIELYDFGGGNVVVAHPFPNDYKFFLTRYVFGLISTNKPYRFMLVEVNRPYHAEKTKLSDVILAALLDAKKRFNEESRPLEGYRYTPTRGEEQ